MTQDQDNKRLITRLYEELFSKWNLGVIDELVAPEFMGHEIPPGFSPGRVGFREFYAFLRSAFPDLQFTVEDMIADGDKVVVRWKWRATHQGDFLGIPPTGRDAPMTGIAIYRLSEGAIVERWVEADLFGLTGRLRAGVSPT